MATPIEQATAGHSAGLLAAGHPAKGEFRCTGCGYGVAVHDELPDCPMCRGDLWEPAPWRPFSRAWALPGDTGDPRLTRNVLL